MKYSDKWNSKCSFFIGKECNDSVIEYIFYTPSICKNYDAVFTIEYIEKMLPSWEKIWNEFKGQSSWKYKEKIINLNGNQFDKNNQIWNDLSMNKHLPNELLSYYKEFWNYDKIMENMNIVWSSDLLNELYGYIKYDRENYNTVVFWESKVIGKLFLDDLLDENYIQGEWEV